VIVAKLLAAYAQFYFLDVHILTVSSYFHSYICRSCLYVLSLVLTCHNKIKH